MKLYTISRLLEQKKKCFTAVKTDMSKAYDWLEWDFIDMSKCIGRDLLKPLVGRLIGSGRSTPIWRTPWLSLTSPQAPMGPPTEVSQNWLVSDLLNPDSQNWDLQRIKLLFPDLEKVILRLKPSKTGALDEWAWLPTHDGAYTTKSGYFQALLRSDPEPMPAIPVATNSTTQTLFNWKTQIWLVTISPKTKLLMWKMIQKALPMGVNLSQRQVTDCVKCVHCGQLETELHLFFTCSFPSQIWRSAPFKFPLNPQNVLSIKEGVMTANKLICLPPTGVGIVSMDLLDHLDFSKPPGFQQKEHLSGRSSRVGHYLG